MTFKYSNYPHIFCDKKVSSLCKAGKLFDLKKIFEKEYHKKLEKYNQSKEEHYKKKLNKMIVTTTSTLQNIEILEYLGIVSVHVDCSIDYVYAALVKIDNLFEHNSKRVSLYNKCLLSLKKKAYDCGANAIIGIKFDIKEMPNKQMLVIDVIGTAVKIKF